MMKFKKLILKILYPHPAVVIISVLLSAIALIYVFSNSNENSFYAPVVYAFSFYALCVATANVVPIFKKAKSFLHKNEHTKRYLSEASLRARISLRTGTAINVIFAIFKFMAGIYYNSFWFIAVALYYFVLSVIRFVLISRDKASARLTTSSFQHQWKSFRLCAYMLFLLNTTISGMVFQMIWQEKSFSYPGFIIYASAAYTFYRFIIAIIRLASKKESNPILLSSKALDLSISLMSVFSLQTAMLNTFGADMPQATCTILNIFTGSAVCLGVVCIAVIMIFKSNKKIKTPSEES